MTFLTSMALRRPTVTVLAIILILGSGVSAYRSLQVELFPQIDFPLVAVFVAYPSADPEAVVRSVTDPIERAISDTPELESIQSTSSEGRSAIFANFRYGTDMAEAQAAVEAAVSGIAFPDGVQEPDVGRFNPDDFPVIQFSVISDRPLRRDTGDRAVAHRAGDLRARRRHGRLPLPAPWTAVCASRWTPTRWQPTTSPCSRSRVR